MEKEELEIVLKELLEEQAAISRQLTDLLGSAKEIKTELVMLRENTEKEEPGAATETLKGLQQNSVHLFAEIRKLQQQRELQNRENNFQIFLKSDAKKWLVILVVSLFFLTYLYLLFRQLV